MVRTALPAAIPAALTSVLSGTVLSWIRIKGALELEWDEPASYPTRPIVGRKQAGRKQAGRRRRPGLAQWRCGLLDHQHELLEMACWGCWAPRPIRVRVRFLATLNEIRPIRLV
jgi:hypothetical protein